jgi:hypothetical protein
MVCAVFREPLGYSRKLGECLLDVGSELGDLLNTLANCPKARSASVRCRVKAVYWAIASVSATWRTKAEEWPTNTNGRRVLLATCWPLSLRRMAGLRCVSPHVSGRRPSS